MLNKMLKLHVLESMGPDNCIHIVKNLLLMNYFAIVKIFENSINSSEIPTDWKNAITAIFKES